MTTTTTAMPRLRELAAASRQATEAAWQRETEERLARERARIARERELAIEAAHRTLRDRFPGTLARFLELEEDSLSFAGYPPVATDDPYAREIPSCAVAHLGEGIWLHHAVYRAAGYTPEVVLLTACACGRYHEIWMSDDYSLAQALDEADAHRSACPDACASSRTPAQDEDEVPW